MRYSNTQIGYPFFVACFSVLATVFTITKLGLQETKGENDIIVLIVVLSIVLLMTFRLKVNIVDNKLELTYGIGLYKKRFDLTDVKKVTLVKNKWYCGWGVRISSEGTIYNISGFDGVKVDLQSGVSFIVGTNKPIELFQVLNKFIL